MFSYFFSCSWRRCEMYHLLLFLLLHTFFYYLFLKTNKIVPSYALSYSYFPFPDVRNREMHPPHISLHSPSTLANPIAKNYLPLSLYSQDFLFGTDMPRKSLEGEIARAERGGHTEITRCLPPRPRVSLVKLIRSHILTALLYFIAFLESPPWLYKSPNSSHSPSSSSSQSTPLYAWMMRQSLFTFTVLIIFTITQVILFSANLVHPSSILVTSGVCFVCCALSFLILPFFLFFHSVSTQLNEHFLHLNIFDFRLNVFTQVM